MPNFIKLKDDSGENITVDLKGLGNGFECLLGDLEYCEVGTKIELEIVEMTQDEFDNLPEFNG